MTPDRPLFKPFGHDIGHVPKAGLMSIKLHRYWWGFKRPGSMAREHGFFRASRHSTRHLQFHRCELHWQNKPAR